MPFGQAEAFKITRLQQAAAYAVVIHLNPSDVSNGAPHQTLTISLFSEEAS